MLITIPIIIAYIVAFGAVCIYAYKSGKITDLLPSISWGGSIIIPFLFVVLPFSTNPEALFLQIIGMCIIGFSLLAADYVSLKHGLAQDATKERELHIKKSIRRKDAQSRLLFWCNLLCITITLASIVIHLSRIGWSNIPILSSFMQNEIDHALVNHLRFMFSREADLTIFEKYFYNFSVVVFGLPALAYLMVTKRFYSMVALFATCTFYLVASTAKMPFMIFFCVFALLAVHIIYPKHKNRILGIGILAIISVVIIGGIIRVPFPYSYITYAIKGKTQGCEIYTEQTPRFCDMDATLADYYRLPLYRQIERPYFIRLYDYSTYRMLVTPVDVNYRWYEYFSQPGKYLGFASIIPQWRPANFIHPAFQVGQFAYASRFPEEYAHAYAYGGMDADAFARAGLWGVALISVLLFLARISPTYLHAGHAFSEIYRLMVIGLLIILPPSSSLQAMLIAHGLIVIIGAIVFFKFYDTALRNMIKQRTEKRKRKLERLPIH